MFKKEHYLHVAKLIANEINGSISESDKATLADWLEESEDNKMIYKAIMEEGWYQSIVEEIEVFDIDKGWQKVQGRIHSKAKVMKLFPRVYKYIAAVLVVGLLITGYIFKDNWFSTTQNNKPIIVNNQIKTGSNKATLTFEDGTQVILEKGTTLQMNNMTSNGEEIIYTDNKKPSEDIEYNVITIPRGGQFFIKLNDGTQVWLNSESQLRYPVNFIDGETRQVDLVYGEAYFDVSPSTEHKGLDFKVYHDQQEVQVLGTEFNIKAYKDETNVYTTLAEGKVAINYNNKTQLLDPGEQSILDSNTNVLKITNVDVKIETAWKEGDFNFIQGKSLKEIMKILSRWYDFDIIFENESLEDVRFKGILGKNQNVEEILSAIKSTSINNYEINNKTIILK
ncbi:FecR family protein [Flavivirga sp. 57AJ16]|uniref:FecR family protein n=1 Tax=Flavivirga sp. 57AJ16 TaxID=3025307 RepID=UPI0023670E7F|nr:FecR family protein [Flavivirga sp. 57AJ16]MDD7888230.1 FecR family protein [Flavivirga sp. 57AJ16]